MNDQNGRDEDQCLLTVSEFIKLAGDRGRKLWTLEKEGKLRITDGRRSYSLRRLKSGRLPSAVVASLLFYFAMEAYAPDFALGPLPED